MTTATTTTAEEPAKTRTSEATWEGGYRCRVQAGGFELRVDEPVTAGGDGTGPQPTDLFLASFASCFALSVAHVARKRGIELEDLSVRAVGTYGGPKFVNIRIEVTSSHDRAELEKLVERASAVCYVSNTLRVLDDTEVVITG
jgi:putative redox protein